MELVEVGFWAPLGAAEQPSGTPSHGRPRARSCVDTEWDAHERALVLSYVRYAGYLESYELGYSTCRFGCGSGRAMGCAALTDGVFVWPEAYWHYIVAHGVRPPPAFVKHVRSAAAAIQRDTSNRHIDGLGTSNSAEAQPLGLANSSDLVPAARRAEDAASSQAAALAADDAGLVDPWFRGSLPAPSRGPLVIDGDATSLPSEGGAAGPLAAVVLWPVRHAQHWDAAERRCVPLPAATRQYLRGVSTLLL
jgi:hypothetical protein